ncbi:MAG TPA: glutamate 5-kinase [Gammaproteobacteria bacterium]
MGKRSKLTEARRLVIKIGSSLITQDGRGLASEAIQGWAEQMAQLIEGGRQLVLVSSGAVAAGMSRLGWDKRPHELHNLQAAAAIGQMGLIQSYESTFKQHRLLTAQVLLSHDDLADRRRYLNARSTLNTLLELRVVPIVNENDTVATEEIRFGDNDSLAAMVANLVEADLLILLTDQAGLYEADPRKNPAAKLIAEADCEDPALEQMAGGSHGALGRGGMSTKLQAARTAARSGADTIIMSGREQHGLLRVLQGEPLGTLLSTEQESLTARKQWLAGKLIPKGNVILDDGAVKVLRDSGRSLLPVGVTAIKGSFRRGDLVTCTDKEGREVARGLINYSAEETEKIKGCSSKELEQRLGYIDEPELIHRDNLVITT